MMSSHELPSAAADLVSAALEVARHDAERPVVTGDEHWGRMLTLAADVRLAAAAGDAALLAALRIRRRAVARQNVPTDHCSTWLDLLVVAELHAARAAEPDDLRDALAVAEHVLGVPRTSDGMLAVEGPDGTPWAFTDTVHFALVPIAALAEPWGRPDLREFAAIQVADHLAALRVPAGVAHGVSRRGGMTAGEDWGRSTGYLVHGLADAQSLGLLEDAPRAREASAELLDALAEAQGADGMWQLRPLRRDGGPEDSGSALILSALVSAGAIAESRIAAGARALRDSIVPDENGRPTLARVAEEIPIAGVEDYDRVRRDRFPWGTATLVRLAASLATLSPALTGPPSAHPTPSTSPEE